MGVPKNCGNSLGYQTDPYYPDQNSNPHVSFDGPNQNQPALLCDPSPPQKKEQK